jgi:hypothetical protein
LPVDAQAVRLHPSILCVDFSKGLNQRGAKPKDLNETEK